MALGSGSKFYKPGEIVPTAGIYKVLHRDHRESHEASLKEGRSFPACKTCGTHVRFRLLLAVEDGTQNTK